MKEPLRIYIDFEFSDFIQRDIISIGAVTESGETFYKENSDEDGTFASEWVKLNVYPLLEKTFEVSAPLVEIEARLWAWFDDLDSEQIQIVADYKGDYQLLVELLGEEHPKFVEDPILVYDSFIATCFSKGILDPDFQSVYCLRECKDFFFSEFMGWFQENGLIQHHALSGAKAIQFAFEKTLAKFDYLNVLRK